MPKWQWLPVERPVEPMRAMSWPLWTFCPRDEATADTLFYSVDKIRLEAVENTDKNTTITVQAVLHKLLLSNQRFITGKDEKLQLKLYRARYPQRLKSKGQAVFQEKECPRCGANFMPDQNGCCSYCGYQLMVDNSKWRIVKE